MILELALTYEKLKHIEEFCYGCYAHKIWFQQVYRRLAR